MKKKLSLWILLFIFLSTYSYHGKKESEQGFFSVKEIEILGIKNSSREDLDRRLEKIKKKNLIFIQNEDFKEIIKDIDFINSLRIKKLYPNKIRVTVIEDFPIGTYLDENGDKYLLLENKKIIRSHNYKSENLPEVHGKGALEKFSDFYSSIKKTKLNLKLVEKFNYYEINRWDLLLTNGKLIKLPPENYEESVVKFLEIYEKSSFEKFKVFDFRIKNELIVK